MRIYIAAPYETRDQAIVVMHRLEALGHEVTSRWLTTTDALDAASALKDLRDICAADVLLALNDATWERSGTGGRHVELGYALALGKQVVLVGRRSNIFHYLEQVRVIESVEEL